MKVTINDFDLKQITDSGQCFRMHMMDDARAELIAHGRRLEIENTGNGCYEFSCDKEEYESIWETYFDLKTDYSAYIKAIDPEDSFLTRAAGYGKGIRILRQDPFETLISFIISQRKNIPAIQASVEKLCRLCGDRIEGEAYAFPKPQAISALSEDELKGCSLGYRAPYVREAADRVAKGDTDLYGLKKLSDEELMKELLSFYGVGKKVANCVMLFAYHRISAFPVDVWIERVLDEYYEGHFPTDKYPGFAGVMQQYMFFYIRRDK